MTKQEKEQAIIAGIKGLSHGLIAANGVVWYRGSDIRMVICDVMGWEQSWEQYSIKSDLGYKGKKYGHHFVYSEPEKLQIVMDRMIERRIIVKSKSGMAYMLNV